ncbi:MAG: PilZ domain-containing protein [Myxococcales bacterium]|nr:PilZ domain-containing protein [Myxococcales bacterium]
MNSTTTSDPERRHAPRVAVYLAATYRSSSRVVDAHVVNLSQSGLFLKCSESDKIGTRADIELVLPNRDPLRLSGTVVWSDVSGMGIQFGNLDRTDRMALANFIMGHIARD